ncbi:BglG family transcription antiterminator [Virgibacillus necropolis]|uniref:Uncharacterized protein n=1 Tax=Virgibacillus necropolis TaxID=163877 RepID=A0A221M9H8_9BACI|nr:BglG family transcription antiterminator [Virgibacillus necropolis]ASN04295.1 hypothetical protein CFK40_04360 [Virgibacillus necropolis]
MLAHLNKRMLKALKLLSKTNDYLSSIHLSQKMGVTSRTVREDIKNLNHILKEYSIFIDSSRGNGFKLSNSSGELNTLINQFENVLSDNDFNPIMPEDRVRYMIKKLLYSPESIKIQAFVEDLYVSESTIKNDIQRAKLILNKYNISISKDNKGLYVEGHELNKRFCISDYLIHSSAIDDRLILSFINNNSYIISDSDLVKIKSTILYYLNEENMVISDFALKKIAVHIAIVISRIKTGQYIDLKSEDFSNLTNEGEYRISGEIVKAIGKEFKMSFSQDETVYMTMHLVGNRISQAGGIPTDLLNYLGEDIYKLSYKILNEVGSWIKEIDLKKEKEFVYSLGLHLKQLLHRLSFNMNIRNPMLSIIKIKYPLAFEAGVVSAKTIMKETGFQINENEIGFLALHFGVVIEKQRLQTLSTKKKKIALVCASGMATSELLLTKLSHILGSNYYMIGTYALHQIDELTNQQPDIILTTVPIEEEVSIPILIVPSILDDSDIDSIKGSLTKLEGETSSISQFIKEDLFFQSLTITTKHEALQFLTEKMIDKGYINDKIKQSILARENISSTAIGNMVAIPHPLEVEMNQSCICTAILEHEIPWNAGEDVSIIFIIVLEEKWRPKFQEIFIGLYDIIHSSDNVLTLSKQKNFYDFIGMINSMK